MVFKYLFVRLLSDLHKGKPTAFVLCRRSVQSSRPAGLFQFIAVLPRNLRTLNANERARVAILRCWKRRIQRDYGQFILRLPVTKSRSL
jgi:hypothetical protein